MYVLQNKENVDMDLGFVDLKSSQPGPRKVRRKVVAKRRARNKAARQSRRKNG
jgi:hypothetical protein